MYGTNMVHKPFYNKENEILVAAELYSKANEILGATQHLRNSLLDAGVVRRIIAWHAMIMSLLHIPILSRYAVDYEKVTNSAMEAIKKLEALGGQKWNSNKDFDHLICATF
ncbi:hypothetical protein Tco_1267470, partial [Tanacetum coccineum]